jgi:23S rRNA pseudouridine1911/1915/1917 synthase
MVVPPELAGPLDRALRAMVSQVDRRGPDPAVQVDRRGPDPAVQVERRGPDPAPGVSEGAQARSVSWGRVREWIRRGKVSVDGVVVVDEAARVRVGARVELNLAARAPGRRELGDDTVVHCDAHVVVVDKPSGVSTVPWDEADVDTLDARVRGWLERRAGAGRGGPPPLGVVQRLDKETSGLVVFTRTWLAKKSLAGQLRRHTVHRRYLAIAHGDVAPRTIRSRLVEDRGDGLRGSARSRGAAGAREAITHVERVERLRGATLVACRLETGRTHQIRIHLSEAGHPVVGERVYVRRYAAPLIEAPRLMLHAAELGFVHPATEREVRFERAPPADFQKLLESLRS